LFFIYSTSNFITKVTDGYRPTPSEFYSDKKECTCLFELYLHIPFHFVYFHILMMMMIKDHQAFILHDICACVCVCDGMKLRFFLFACVPTSYNKHRQPRTSRSRLCLSPYFIFYLSPPPLLSICLLSTQS
jgi:hypothetical protein